MPALFKSEEQLRALWSAPETRHALLEQLAEAGFGRDALGEMQKVVAADNSDIYDVLAFVAFAAPIVKREVRATHAGQAVLKSLTEAQRAFVTFVLDHYVSQGVDQLDVDKLSPLLKLKYGSINDATSKLGSPGEIRKLFIEFQQYLYEKLTAS